jgi:uncharacterized membrane protein
MDIDLVVRWAHVLGAAVLFGTGAGIAFFMVMAHRSGDVKVIAGTARTVVIGDFLFTATAVVLQPVTGLWLANAIGWSLLEGWVILSILLYLVAGLFWLPVVRWQIRIRDIADEAVRAGSTLPGEYYRLYRIWLLCGFPAFLSVLAIYWLMIAKPSVDLFS